LKFEIEALGTTHIREGFSLSQNCRLARRYSISNLGTLRDDLRSWLRVIDERVSIETCADNAMHTRCDRSNHSVFDLFSYQLGNDIEQKKSGLP